VTGQEAIAGAVIGNPPRQSRVVGHGFAMPAVLLAIREIAPLFRGKKLERAKGIIRYRRFSRLMCNESSGGDLQAGSRLTALRRLAARSRRFWRLHRDHLLIRLRPTRLVSDVTARARFTDRAIMDQMARSVLGAVPAPRMI